MVGHARVALAALSGAVGAPLNVWMADDKVPTPVRFTVNHFIGRFRLFID